MNQISFGIYANQTDKRWNTFIKEMNERFDKNYKGSLTGEFYGCDSRGNYYSCPNENIFAIIITLDEYFAEGSVYRVVKPTFKRGDRILVWDKNEDKARERIALCLIEGSNYPVIVVCSGDEEDFLQGRKFDHVYFTHWKPIPTERQKLQQEIEQLEKELEVKRNKLKEL